MNELSDKIRQLRHAQKLSQTELAEKIGVTQPYITEIEKGKKTPSVDVLEKLCGALGCSADFLLGIARQKHNTVKQNDGPSGLTLSPDLLREVMERNISADELKLALRVAEVLSEEKKEKS